MQSEPFYSALPLAEDLYGVEIDEDKFETWGMVGWNKIGNKSSVVKHTVAHTEEDEFGNHFVMKPCDADQIESITLPCEDVLETHAILEHPERIAAPIENWIEANKSMTNILYLPGKFVKYTETGDKLYFSEPYSDLHILYRSTILDQDLLPYLNEKEKFAIATYVAYCYFYRKALLTKDLSELTLATALKADWLKACDQARTPEYVSQNEMNKIMDAMVSYDRHSYGRTTKIL